MFKPKYLLAFALMFGTFSAHAQEQQEVQLPFTLKKIEGAELLAKHYNEKAELWVPGVNGNMIGQAVGFFYHVPASLNLSPKEIFDSYKTDLKQQGFKVNVEDGQIPALFNKVCTEQANFCGEGSFHSNRGSLTPDKPFEYDRYAALGKKIEEGDIRVAIVARKVTSTGAFAWNKGKSKNALADKKSFTEGDVVLLVLLGAPKVNSITLVKEDMNFLANSLKEKGSVNVYGIYFDTDKANIKPESDTTLAEIAKLLASDATLSLDIVGHTDNIGAAEHNQKLSEDRAVAVVAALKDKYHADATKLKASGMGASKPIADNATEEGRAKNRRVELVKK